MAVPGGEPRSVKAARIASASNLIVQHHNQYATAFDADLCGRLNHVADAQARAERQFVTVQGVTGPVKRNTAACLSSDDAEHGARGCGQPKQFAGGEWPGYGAGSRQAERKPSL